MTTDTTPTLIPPQTAAEVTPEHLDVAVEIIMRENAAKLRYLAERYDSDGHDVLAVYCRAAADRIEANGSQALTDALRDMAEAQGRVKELEAENERLRAHLITISADFRSAAGYDVALKAYCMRSEAQVALGLTRQELWDEELAKIRALMAKPEKDWPCGCIEVRPECPFGKKHCPDCCCDGCIENETIGEVDDERIIPNAL